MLRFTAKQLEEFVFSLRTCFGGWKHFKENTARYMEVLEDLKAAGTFYEVCGEGNRGYFSNIEWLRDEVDELKYLPKAWVECLNDDFFKALEACGELSFVQYLEVLIARCLQPEPLEAFSREEIAAIAAPCISASTWRRWGGLSILQRFRYEIPYLFRCAETEKVYTRKDLEKLSGAELRRMHFFVALSREEVER